MTVTMLGLPRGQAAWGGDVLTPVGPFGMDLTPADTIAPVVILTGRAEKYGTAANFTNAVLSSNLRVARPNPKDTGTADFSITWNTKQHVMHAQNKAGK